MTQIEFWQQRWQEDSQPWDLGGPHQASAEFVKKLEGLHVPLKGSKMHIPGCGHGHDASLFAQFGVSVDCSDIVDTAVEKARAIAQKNWPGEIYNKVQFHVRDALSATQNTELAEQHNFVFDRAFWCAIEPRMREQFIAGVLAQLKPGGFFLTIPFTELKVEKGPPFALSIDEIKHALVAHFNLVDAWSYQYSGDASPIICEHAMIWQKRETVLNGGGKQS